MKIELLEKVKDHYINLYEVWIFIRAIEYSAYEVFLVLDYKYYLNINKKTWFVFLESWFPKNMLDKNIQILVWKWYSVRYINKQNEITFYLNKLILTSNK